MLMTEVQAADKICPHQRAAARQPVAHCCASRCAHWRWSQYKFFGFCGLSGQPLARHSLIWRVMAWLTAFIGLAALVMAFAFA